MRSAAIYLGALLLWLLAAAPAGMAAPRPEIMLVLDASVAMQQPFGTETRMAAATHAVSRVLERHGKLARLGIIAFGHRRSRSCEDIEVIKPTRGTADAATLRVVSELKPQGPAPVAKAFDFAARLAGGAGGPVRIVLVTASPDTCEADPCAIAKLLADSRPVRIDVVALGSGEQAAFRPLKCAAKRTGGTFTAAGGSVDLSSALSAAIAASTLARLDQGDVAEGTSAPNWTAEAEATDSGSEPSSGEIASAASAAFGEGAAQADELAAYAAGRPTTEVSMSALIAEGGSELASGLVWRIFDPGAGAEAGPRQIAKLREAAPTVALPAGTFLVNVAYGRANVTRRIEVREGEPIAESFVLNAGGLRLGARLVGGGEPPPLSVTFDIYSDDRDQRGDRLPVLKGAKPGTIIRLNAGLYHLVSSYGDANAVAAADISIEAGKLSEVTVEHSGAAISFRLVQASGGEALADVTWRILTVDGEMIQESAGALPTHVLAPGEYLIEARRADKRYSERLIVEPGRARQLEIVATE